MHEINYTNLMEGIIGTWGCVNKAAVCAVDSLLREQLGSCQGEVNVAGATTCCHHTFCHETCNYLIKETSGGLVEKSLGFFANSGFCNLGCIFPIILHIYVILISEGI